MLERNPTRRASLDQLAPIANRLSAECTSTVDSNLNVPAPDPTSDCDSHERRMKSCDRSLNSDARLGLCTKSNELQTRKDVLLDNLKSGRESEHYNELSPGRDNSDQTSDRKMDVKSREVPMMTTRSKKAVTVDSKAQTRDQQKTTINSSSSTSISMNLGKAIAYVLNPSVNSYVASQDSRDLNIERQVVRDTNSEIGTHQKSQKSHSSRVLATGSSRVENTTIHKASDVWSDDEFVIIDSCNDTKNRELNIPETVTKNNEVDQFKESNSVQAVLGSMVKRSEVYMKAIKVFILLADKTFENALISSKVVGNGMMNINPNVSKKLVDQCLAALSLYFHSLEIMKSLVKSFETFVKSDLRSLNTPVEKFREVSKFDFIS